MVLEFGNPSGESFISELRRPILINVGKGDVGENIGKSIALRSALAKIGTSPEVVASMVNGRFVDSKAPYTEDLPSGGTVEHVVVRTTQSDGRAIEVSDCTRDNFSTQKVDEADLQHNGLDQRYKILVGRVGEAMLHFPRTIDMAGKKYALSKDETLHLGEGAVVIIPAGVTWYLDNPQSAENHQDDGVVNYLYISYPPYSDEIDKKIQVLN